MNYFTNTCRICMENKNVSLTLNTLDSDNKQLLDKLIIVTPEIFEQNLNNLPHQICTFCHEQLNQAYKFKKKCLESHEQLKRYLKQQDVSCEYIHQPQRNITHQTTTETYGNIPTYTEEKNTENYNTKEEKTDNKINPIIDNIFNDASNDNSSSSFYFSEEYVNNDNCLNVETIITESSAALSEKNLFSRNTDCLSTENKLNISNLEDNISESLNYLANKVQNKRSLDSDDDDFDDEDDEPLISRKFKLLKFESIPNPNNPNEFTVTHPSKSDLKFIYVTDELNDLFYCKNCDKQFNNINALKQHIKRHISEKKFQCNICNYKCFTAFDLQRHHALQHKKENHKTDRSKTVKQDESIKIDQIVLSKILKKMKLNGISSLDNPVEYTVNHPAKQDITFVFVEDYINEIFYCKNCDKKYNTSNALMQHLNRHLGERKYKCRQCNLKYFSNYDLRRHVSEQHPNDKENKLCNICNKTFKSFRELKDHKLEHEDSDESSDDEPVKTSKPRRKTKLGGVPNPNNPAEYTVTHPTNNDIIFVYINDPRNKKFSCKNCDKPFNTFDSLKQHLKRHFDGKKFECDKCDYKSNQKCHLDTHIIRHHSTDVERNFVCDVCHKSFAFAIDLKHHKLIHDKRFICEICAKPFATSNDLTNHKYVHSDEKNFVCSICGWSGKRPNALYLHMRSRHRTDPQAAEGYKCPVCQKTYASKDSLAGHIKSHNESNYKFECSVCERRFIDKSKMVVHMRIHSGEKPYKCEHCDKTFRQSGYYKIHLRQHTGEKPFACQFCEKKFTNGTQLKIHLRIHTGERPYKCEHCGKGFIRSSKCKRHMKTHEKKNKPPPPAPHQNNILYQNDQTIHSN